MPVTGLAPSPSPRRASTDYDTTNEEWGLSLATSGDRYLATSGDFFMATDTPCSLLREKRSGVVLTCCERATTCGQARSLAGIAGPFATTAPECIPSSSAVLPSWSCVPLPCPRSTHTVQQHPVLTSAHGGRQPRQPAPIVDDGSNMRPMRRSKMRPPVGVV